MQYPVWDSMFMGGGLLIALVATIHVFLAHFAVGGGFLFIFCERLARRQGSRVLQTWLKGFAKNFVFISMVFGGVTGVGIWFSIAIVSPDGTSLLIHDFAFGWATEWVFFLGEIIALLLYVKTFDHPDKKLHDLCAYVFTIMSFGSLFLVQGLIAFMLTPGKWLETKSFWDGFFNPSFLPGLGYRFLTCLAISAVFGLLASLSLHESKTRGDFTRRLGFWLGLSVAGSLVFAHLNFSVLDPIQTELFNRAHSEIALAKLIFFACAGVLLICGGLIWLVPICRGDQPLRFLGIISLAAAFFFLGGFEWMRESARRPWIITKYMYSNGYLVSKEALVNEKGALATAKWTLNKTLTPDNRLQAGRELYVLQCLGCHSVGGPMNEITKRAKPFGVMGMRSLLTGLGKIDRRMPPFLGLPAEREALAGYVSEDLLKLKPAPEALDLPKLTAEVPGFDADKAEYALVAYVGSGVSMVSDCDSVLKLGMPEQSLYALLVKRGPSPERQAKDVKITCELGQNGVMELTAEPGQPIFKAEKVVINPYESGSFNPYPVAKIQAKDASGKVLAETKAVLPLSTEMGCKNCHGGGWKVDGRAGLSEATAREILAAHDRLSNTNLADQAASGKPVECRSCHAQGKGLGLSASLHGFHALYIDDKGPGACNSCHPTSPQGASRAFRGVHEKMDVNCTRCHGDIQEHSAALLLKEKELGQAAAGKLLGFIAHSLKEFPAPRAAWKQQPDCLACHKDFAKPEAGARAVGQWSKEKDGLYRVRLDDLSAMPCAGCHGASHALYPAKNPYAAELDNLQPLQMQGQAAPLGAKGKCGVCHQMDMDIAAHHSGMGL